MPVPPSPGTPDGFFFAKRTKLAFFTICLKTLKQKICHLPEMPCSFKMVWHYFTCWITFPQPAVRFVCKYWTKWQSRATFCFRQTATIRTPSKLKSELDVVCQKKSSWQDLQQESHMISRNSLQMMITRNSCASYCWKCGAVHKQHQDCRKQR